VVLHGCDTCSATVNAERRLKEFQQRILRRIFRPKRYEDTGNCSKLHNEELNYFYSSPSIRVFAMMTWKRVRLARHVARMKANRIGGRLLVGNQEGKGPQNKQTPWPLVRERTILTERPPLVDEI
jgi:hypothetical protein